MKLLKKHRFAAAVLTLCILLSSCGKESGGGGMEEADLFDPSNAILHYETGAINFLCTGENGTLYTYSRKGKKLTEYNAKGEYANEYPLEAKDVYAISFYGGTLYYISGKQLCAMELATGASEVLHTFDGDMFMFGRMAALDDSVFIIRKEQYKEEWAELDYAEEYGYTYGGEELLCFSISTGEMEKPDIPNIKQISRKNDRELLVYAYDDEGGFYFTVYHTDGRMEEKRYTGIKFGTVNDIAYDEELDQIVCTDFEGVFLTRLDDFSGKAYAYENAPVGYQTFSCADGFTYDIFDVNGKDILIRLQNRLLVRDVPALKGYALSRFFAPKRHGYPIALEEIREDEMALVLMAGDADYDFLVLDSSFQIAQNIRRLGAYYPLNSLAGLDALFGDSHAYVKEGATAENGDIWMLPLDVECPFLFYNEKMIEKFGITVSQLSNYTQLLECTLRLPDDGSVLYSIPYLLMMWDVENQYLGNYAIKDGHADFRQEIFKTYLDTRLKFDGRVERDSSLFNNHGEYDYVMSMEGYFENMLFSMERSTVADRGSWLRYDRYDFIHVLPAPGIQEGEKFKNQALVRMLVVNPNSEHKEEVFAYLGEVCGGIRENEYSLMLATNDYTGKPLWQEMQAIVADAVIYFKYPYEIISDEVRNYANGTKSYEDTVSEMERKMDMYLNE